jgi:D-alanyl-lipoteichoic acid acyltransferase DltB (MBOAT superfamily)
VGTVFGAAGQGTEIGALLAWRGALAYALQLYFDFSGYCDMAVGLSRLFGIRLPFNFHSPYQAPGIIDFWRRWHMTLSRFLRDYLYIPMGGNRHGTARRYLNLMMTMLLGGLWHGANWTFVLWGGLHGLYLVVNHLWRALRPAAMLAGVPARLRTAASVALTFAAVVAAWVVFRAPDLAMAKGLLSAMVGANGLGSATGAGFANPFAGMLGLFGLPAHLGNGLDLVRYAAALAVVFGLTNTQQIIEGGGLVDRLGGQLWPRFSLVWRANLVWGLALGVLGAMSMLTFARVSEFLYFQF